MYLRLWKIAKHDFFFIGGFRVSEDMGSAFSALLKNHTDNGRAENCCQTCMCFTFVAAHHLLQQQTHMLFCARVDHRAYSWLCSAFGSSITDDDGKWIQSHSQETRRTQVVHNELTVKIWTKWDLIWAVWRFHKGSAWLEEGLLMQGSFFFFFEAVKPSASYLRWVPCGWPSSSVGTAARSSCSSCSGSRTEGSPAALPRPPGSLCCYPAWLLSPCPRGTGASLGTESCRKGSGCTSQSPGCSPPSLAAPRL